MKPGYMYDVRKSIKDFGARYKGTSVMSRSPRGGLVGVTSFPTELIPEVGREKEWINSMLPGDFPQVSKYQLC